MAMEKEERRVYIIPNNFKQGGYILNGQISKRNAVDGVILSAIGLFVSYLIPVADDARLSLTIFMVGIFGMWGFIGVNGIPVSTYLIDMVKWRRRCKKPYLFNTNSVSFISTAADVHLNETQMRDMVADVLDKVKNTFARETPEYVEGETFQFSEDPTLENLRFADEMKAEKDTAQSAPETPKVENTDAAPSSPSDEVLDIASIVDNIKLEDI